MKIIVTRTLAVMLDVVIRINIRRRTRGFMRGGDVENGDDVNDETPFFMPKPTNESNETDGGK